MKEMIKKLMKEAKNNPASYNALLSLLSKANTDQKIMAISIISEYDKELGERLKRDLFPNIENKSRERNVQLLLVIFSILALSIAIAVLLILKTKQP